MINRKILLVDDESNVLEGLNRHLRKGFDVSICNSPTQALGLLNAQPEFAVVVSDMRMPQMSGVEFLTAVKRLRPDTVRVMLTGNQDQATAAAAVNQGEVYRFLTKPCEAKALTDVLEQAVRQYELVTAERELLSQTLQGSLKVLIEALSITKPAMFGSTDRIERRCLELTSGLAEIETWEMQSAAQLSRIGCIGIPDELLTAISNGETVGLREQELFERHPQRGAQIVDEIPRLHRVAQSILFQHKNFDGSGFPELPVEGTSIPLGGRVLRLVLAFDTERTRGLSETKALAAIHQRREQFDPALVERLHGLCQLTSPVQYRVSANELTVGSIIAQDILNTKGILLVCRGQVITPAVQRHLQHFFELGTLPADILIELPN